jgi:hypothetical protein
MSRLWKYALGLTAMSFASFGIAFAFRTSNSPFMIALVYASTGVFVLAALLAIFAISLIDRH